MSQFSSATLCSHPGDMRNCIRRKTFHYFLNGVIWENTLLEVLKINLRIDINGWLASFRLRLYVCGVVEQLFQWKRKPTRCDCKPFIILLKTLVIVEWWTWVNQFSDNGDSVSLDNSKDVIETIQSVLPRDSFSFHGKISNRYNINCLTRMFIVGFPQPN